MTGCVGVRQSIITATVSLRTLEISYTGLPPPSFEETKHVCVLVRSEPFHTYLSVPRSAASKFEPQITRQNIDIDKGYNT